jgi:hypothetical protein
MLVDCENQIKVAIENNGIGPLILKKLAKLPDGWQGQLIDLIPAPPPNPLFNSFMRLGQIRAIRPGDEVVLVDVSIKDKSAIRYRDLLRKSLGEMTLEFTYTDIYDTPFPVYALV